MLANKKVGLIGAGLMGAPMALNLIKNGFSVSVLPNKSTKNTDMLLSKGAFRVSSRKELAEKSDIILLMLPTSKEVEEVLLEKNGLIHFLKPNHLIIDMTTSEPDSTKKIFKIFQDKNLRFFDSPVTGGVKGATEGTLTLFIGGPMEYFKEAEDVLKAMSRTQKHFGSIGQGHVAKIINNYICIGNLAVFSEALPLAEHLGLSFRDMYETVQSGTAASRMLELYGEQIMAGDFAPRFKLAHAYKDLKLALEITKKYPQDFPMLQGMLQLFEKAMDQQMGDQNVSALIKLFKSNK
jgi:3-hydroxyisobutyrate dehydrogenase-like beta-hydroxyacid dehydrogenase